MVPPVSTLVVPSNHGHDDDGSRPSRSIIRALSDISHTPKQDNAVVYVHPLVKKSSAKLSKKSLEMCTESLGSETGSDIMEEPMINSLSIRQKERKIVAKTKREYNFPPPLTSMNSSLGMEFHRGNGRLVMNAVVFVESSSSSIFHAERINGRLTLRLKKEGQEEVGKSEDTKFKTQSESDDVITSGGGDGKRASNEKIENMEGNIEIDENIARVRRCIKGGGERREGHLWNMETCWVAI